eukprot:COSAG02_NODE_6856_length_3324_cov_155.239070_3_plen_43_part_00
MQFTTVIPSGSAAEVLIRSLRSLFEIRTEFSVLAYKLVLNAT